MTDDEKNMGLYREMCSDNRFEIIARARKHIIEATNIESAPKEMEVLDNFLFRCWQMDWLKNDYRELEKENEEMKAEIQSLNAKLDFFLTETVAGKEYRPKDELDCLKKENEELKEINEMNSLSKVLIQRCKEVGIKDLYHLAEYLTIMENQKHQIEKMKCCGNCKNCVFKYDDEDLIFECDVSGIESYTHLKTCTNWELAE